MVLALKLEDRNVLQPIEAVLSLSEEGRFSVEVQKILFYSDMYAVEKFGGRLTQADYKPMMYGAYSDHISEGLEKLASEREDIITRTDLRDGNTDTSYIHLGETSFGIEDFVQDVLTRISDMTIEELTEFSKMNYLYREADSGEILSFEEYEEALESGEVEPMIIDSTDCEQVEKPDWLCGYVNHRDDQQPSTS